MKKFLVKLAVLAVIIGLIFIPVSVHVDPYNVFHYSAPKYNGVESNKGFIKTKYVLKNKDKFNALVFGSSRAGFMDIEHLNSLTGLNWYDMASSESLVSEQTHELKVFIKNGFIPKEILVMVDDISCFVSPEGHENMLYRIPYPSGGIKDMAEFYMNYFDLIMINDSLKVIKANTKTDDNYAERYRAYGNERLDIESYFDPTEEQYQKGYFLDYYSYRGEEALEDMKELVKVCKAYNIKLTVLTNPLYYLTYDEDVANGYLDYIEGLAKVTDFYNFSCSSDISKNYKNYYETSHFTPEVGRIMLDVIYNPDRFKDKTITSGGEEYNIDILNNQGFGVWVSEYNVEELMNILKN